MAYVRKRRSVKGVVQMTDSSLTNTDDVNVLKQRLEWAEMLLTKTNAEMASQDSIHADELEKINLKLDILLNYLSKDEKKS